MVILTKWLTKNYQIVKKDSFERENVEAKKAAGRIFSPAGKSFACICGVCRALVETWPASSGNLALLMR